MTCTEDVIALQETHLCGAALRDFVRKITAAGFRVYEGEVAPNSGPPFKRGTCSTVSETFIRKGCLHFPFGRMWVCGGRDARVAPTSSWAELGVERLASNDGLSQISLAPHDEQLTYV